MITICTYDEQLLPERKTAGAVCRDIKIAQKTHIPAQSLVVGNMGIKICLPHGWSCRIYARGGLPVKRGCMLGNSVGIVDSDYRGEYMFQIYNFENKDKNLEAYERIGQIEFVPDFFAHKKIQDIKIPEIHMVVDANMYKNFEQIFPTERGEGRFHSTGI